MSSEFIQNVAHEIIMMMIFNISTSYFSQIFISLFWGLFNDETDDLRVKVHWRKTFSRHDKSPKPKFQTSLQLIANRQFPYFVNWGPVYTRDHGWGVAQGPWLMGVNPNLDQRMSHMHFYNSKKIGFFFLFLFFGDVGLGGLFLLKTKNHRWALLSKIK